MISQINHYKFDFDILSKVCNEIDRKLVKYKFLASGGHNDHYLLDTENKGNIEKIVLRVRTINQFDNITNEFKILNMLKGLYGPKCFYIDKTCNLLPKPYLLLQYIDGPLYIHSANNGIPKNLIKVASRYYASLHSIKGEFEPNFLYKDSFSIAKYYDYHFRERYNSSKNILPEFYSKMINRALQRILDIEADWVKYYNKTASASLIQGDPTVGNLIFWNKEDGYNKNKMLLIDWEFARFDHCEFDLVFFLDTYEVKDEYLSIFLNEYGYENKGGDLKKLYFIWLCHLMRIIAWRVERILLVQNSIIKNNRHATNIEYSFKRIERYLDRFNKILYRYQNYK